MNLSNKDLDFISLHCHVIACNMFSTMCNEKYRGPKFTWANFPCMVSEICETQIWINGLSIAKKKKDLAVEHSKKTGKEIAEKMIKNAGFLE